MGLTFEAVYYALFPGYYQRIDIQQAVNLDIPRGLRGRMHRVRLSHRDPIPGA